MEKKRPQASLQQADGSKTRPPDRLVFKLALGRVWEDIWGRRDTPAATVVGGVDLTVDAVIGRNLVSALEQALPALQSSPEGAKGFNALKFVTKFGMGMTLKYKEWTLDDHPTSVTLESALQGLGAKIAEKPALARAIEVLADASDGIDQFGIYGLPSAA